MKIFMMDKYVQNISSLEYFKENLLEKHGQIFLEYANLGFSSTVSDLRVQNGSILMSGRL